MYAGYKNKTTSMRSLVAWSKTKHWSTDTRKAYRDWRQTTRCPKPETHHVCRDVCGFRPNRLLHCTRFYLSKDSNSKTFDLWFGKQCTPCCRLNSHLFKSPTQEISYSIWRQNYDEIFFCVLLVPVPHPLSQVSVSNFFNSHNCWKEFF